jgi:hypothetical protein
LILFYSERVQISLKPLHSFFLRNLTTGDDLKRFFTFRQFLIKIFLTGFLSVRKIRNTEDKLVRFLKVYQETTNKVF